MTTPTPSPKPERKRVHPRRGKKSRTKQAPAAQTDVKLIVRRYRETGDPDVLGLAKGVYGDFTGVDDFHTAMTRVRDAEEAFMELPAEVRQVCRNDPAELIRLMDSEDQAEVELRQELGLEAKPEPSGEPEAPPVEAEPAEPANPAE